MAIAHEQKWVAGIAATITGDVANKHTTIHQWCHKDPFGERIAPGNLEYGIMSPLQAFLHMMPPAQLTLILELTNERLVEKEKQEMTRQELLRWIGVCVLIAGVNFRGRRRNLAPPDKVIIKVAQPMAIAKYYKGAGTIDRHNRLRADELRLDRDLGTKHWDKRFNLGVLGIICVDAYLFFQQVVSSNNRTTSCLEFFGRLADELIDNQEDCRVTRASAASQDAAATATPTVTTRSMGNNNNMVSIV